MTLTLDDLDFLTSETGEALLAALAQQDLAQPNHLRLVTLLRRTYSPDQVRAGLTLALARAKAREKFGAQAERLYFTDEALQQASDPGISAHRAAKFAALDAGRVGDLCCGAGADALALAERCGQVLGVDHDPVRVRMARLNAAAVGRENAQFVEGDVRGFVPAAGDALFFDPARRDDQGDRLHHVEQYLPPLSLVNQWPRQRIAVKLSPGVDLRQVEAYGGCVEFISVQRNLKEAVLWRNTGSAGTCATLVLPDRVLEWSRGGPPEPGRLRAPVGWLVEPDPALIRAGLVEDAAEAWKGFLLDETIAYLTCDRPPVTPWARAWRIVEWMPFNLKKLRAVLRARDIGVVTVKKRGSAITPEQLIADLKLKGAGTCTVVLTRFAGNPIVMVCDDYVP